MVVLFVAKKLVSVEDAVEINPLSKAKVVEVAFSPVPRVVNGNSKEPPLEVGQLVRQSPERQRIDVEAY